MNELRPFHISFPVRDVQEARHFYGEILGCPEGRSADTWVDFNLYGHQIVAHYKPPQPDNVERQLITTQWMATTCPCRISASS